MGCRILSSNVIHDYRTESMRRARGRDGPADARLVNVDQFDALPTATLLALHPRPVERCPTRIVPFLPTADPRIGHGGRATCGYLADRG